MYEDATPRLDNGINALWLEVNDGADTAGADDNDNDDDDDVMGTGDGDADEGDVFVDDVVSCGRARYCNGTSASLGDAKAFILAMFS